MSNIMSYLFETKAVRFCEENKPFWYTSGKIGPYFINTHFVYRSEKDASELLTFIDECLNDKLNLPEKVFQKVLKQYKENEIYHNVIDTMKDLFVNFIGAIVFSVIGFLYIKNRKKYTFAKNFIPIKENI